MRTGMRESEICERVRDSESVRVNEMVTVRYLETVSECVRQWRWESEIGTCVRLRVSKRVSVRVRLREPMRMIVRLRVSRCE